MANTISFTQESVSTWEVWSSNVTDEEYAKLEQMSSDERIEWINEHAGNLDMELVDSGSDGYTVIDAWVEGK